MKFIVEFYKGLDTLNLIIFWGVILVVLLLLFFSLLLINKNKKLKDKINNEKEEKDDFIPIIKKQFDETLEEIKKEKELKKEEKNSILLPNQEFMIEKEITSKEEKVLELKPTEETENVMEYNNDLFALTNIKKNNIKKEELEKNNSNEKTKITIPSKPYQRNVLREISSNQTSPIGINRDIKKEDKIITEAKELQESLKEDSLFIEKTTNESIFEINTKKQLQNEDNYQQEKTNLMKNTHEKVNQAKEVKAEIERKRLSEKRQERYYENLKNIEIPKEKENKLNVTEKIIKEDRKNTDKEIPIRKEQLKNLIEEQSESNKIDIVKVHESQIKPKPPKESNKEYLEEVSKKLSEATQPDDIDRTEYELKQEEEAIISYEELMQKKDTIKMIDEEEAVISIEELMQRKKQEKLYNITEEETNDDFIKELKHFRDDLK